MDPSGRYPFPTSRCCFSSSDLLDYSFIAVLLLGLQCSLFPLHFPYITLPVLPSNSQVLRPILPQCVYVFAVNVSVIYLLLVPFPALPTCLSLTPLKSFFFSFPATPTSPFSSS